MARRKSPESEAVAFFESAPIDVAVAVLNIARGIVQRRQGTKPRRAPATPIDKSRPSLLVDEHVRLTG